MRALSSAQVAQIAGSIRKFGFPNPILIDRENGAIARHGRLMSAQMLGLVSVPVTELGHLNDAQNRASSSPTTGSRSRPAGTAICLRLRWAI